MIVELRAVPDCPNLDATRDLLRACLTEAGLPVTVIERIGAYPSPSVLIDGRDVTGADPNAPAACVLQPPTADQIRTALRTAIDDRSGAGPGDTGTQAAERRQPGGVIRADRARRAAALPTGLRAVHQQLLRHFAATGTAPTPADLVEVAAGAGLDPVATLRRLAEDDFVAVDQAGRLVAAYPFSPTPTGHVVQLDAVRAYAMCAIDALGIPAMLDRDAAIASTDPQTGQPVTVTFAGGVARFDPDTTVVVYAAAGGGGRSVDTCCSTINFFANPTSAQAWISAYPGLAATVLDQASAVALGRDIFGPLLDADAFQEGG